MAKEYEGDDIFDALLALGWTVNVGDNGYLSASPPPGVYGNMLTGELKSDGSIRWTPDDEAGKVLIQGRVLDLKARAENTKNTLPH